MLSRAFKIAMMAALLFTGAALIISSHRTLAQTPANIYVIKQFSITSGSFTAITAPVACNYWSLTPDSSSLIRTTSTDATTQASVPGNTPETLLGTNNWPPPNTFPQTFPRYQAGATIAYMESVGATATVYGRFAY